MSSQEGSSPPPGSDWLSALSALSARGEDGVLATITAVRGHSPRDVGAKMAVTGVGSYGSIGGGNMEATVIDRAREMLAAHTTRGDGDHPRIDTLEFGLNEHAHNQHGNQCCGGVVEVLIEYLPARPTVAVFGIGHVGEEIARILSRHETVLHLADSRADILSPQVQDLLNSGPATVHLHTTPAPEVLLATLPPGAHVLILTHDHAEDLVLCDAALRHGQLNTIGVIGSRAKWLRFRKKLLELGHPEAAVEHIHCPIGVPDITGKHPAVIAVSVAADLLRILTKATP